MNNPPIAIRDVTRHIALSAAPTPPADADNELRFYGRRKGRRLRQTRQRLVEDLLPELSLSMPPPGHTLAVRDVFAPGITDVWMEIGFGTGEHLLAQALRHRTVGFVGAEPYVNGVAALLPALVQANLDNIRVFADDARKLLPALPDACIGRLFVLFPDPWPKTRHHGRRLLSPETIRSLARVVRPGGELRLASDHAGYVRWIMEHITRDRSFRWLARRAADWRNRLPDSPMTRYEQKAIARGQTCMHLRFIRAGL